MGKAIIIYLNLGGKTGYFSFKIGEFLARYNIEVKIVQAHDIDFSILDRYDYCLIGYPTNGFLFLSRARYTEMREFCNNLFELYKGKVLLFTTYSLTTGLIIFYTKRYFKFNNTDEIPIIKSKTCILTEDKKIILKLFIGFNSVTSEKMKINQIQSFPPCNKNIN